MTYRQPIESPFDPAQTNLQPEELDLADVMAEAMRALCLRLRVAVPAKIVTVLGDQKVDVQPLIQSRFKNSDTLITLPVVKNCPVIMPRGGGYAIRLPIAVGDTGVALIGDRSLDSWLASAGSEPTDPQDTRAHDLNDVMFIPGLVPFASQTQEGASVTDLVLSCGSAQVRLLQAGQLKIGNTAGTELLTLMDGLLTQAANLAQRTGELATLVGTLTSTVASGVITTPAGPGAFNPATIAALTALQSQATTLSTGATSLQQALQQVQTSLAQIKASS